LCTPEYHEKGTCSFTRSQYDVNQYYDPVLSVHKY